jgi:hypothetical protein
MPGLRRSDTAGRGAGGIRPITTASITVIVAAQTNTNSNVIVTTFHRCAQPTVATITPPLAIAANSASRRTARLITVGSLRVPHQARVRRRRRMSASVRTDPAASKTMPRTMSGVDHPPVNGKVCRPVGRYTDVPNTAEVLVVVPPAALVVVVVEPGAVVVADVGVVVVTSGCVVVVGGVVVVVVAGGFVVVVCGLIVVVGGWTGTQKGAAVHLVGRAAVAYPMVLQSRLIWSSIAVPAIIRRTRP